MKKRTPKTGRRTIDSRGSSIKTRAGTKPPASGTRAKKARARAAPKWQEARIAYDDRGNIVVLDKRVATRLRGLVRRGGMLDLGFPDTNLRVTDAKLEEPAPLTPPGGVRPINNQCQCGLLRLAVVSESTTAGTQTPLF